MSGEFSNSAFGKIHDSDHENFSGMPSNDSPAMSNENEVSLVPRNAAQSSAQASVEQGVPPSYFLRYNFVEKGIEADEWGRLKGIVLKEGRDLEELPIREICTGCDLLYEHVDLEYLRCGHFYCEKCISKILYLVLQKVNQYPPRCCTLPIGRETVVLIFMEPRLFDLYKRLIWTKEKSVRLYCSAKTCSAAIPEDRIANGVGACAQPNCLVKTCVKCKQDMAIHTSHNTCPPDHEKDVLLALATKERWQSCKGCGNLIERIDGCNHMDCENCGFEFCYLCGGSWPSCNCGLLPVAVEELPFRNEQPEEEAQTAEDVPQENGDLAEDYCYYQGREGEEVADLTRNENQEDGYDDRDFGDDLDQLEEDIAHSNLDEEALRPRTAEEADPRSYADDGIWYHVPKFDPRQHRRRTTEELEQEEKYRLDREIDRGGWIHVETWQVEHSQHVDRLQPACSHDFTRIFGDYIEVECHLCRWVAYEFTNSCLNCGIELCNWCRGAEMTDKRIKERQAEAARRQQHEEDLLQEELGPTFLPQAGTLLKASASSTTFPPSDFALLFLAYLIAYTNTALELFLAGLTECLACLPNSLQVIENKEPDDDETNSKEISDVDSDFGLPDDWYKMLEPRPLTYSEQRYERFYKRPFGPPRPFSC